MIQIKTTWGFNEKTEICVRDWGGQDRAERVESSCLQEAGWLG